MPLVDLFFWPLVFQFLGPDDLVRVSAVSFTWWRNVFQGCKSTAKMLLECEGIDLAETGNLYQKVPLRFFALKKMINLKGTSISPKDFLKLVAVAKELRILNLESCVQITERSIFQAKPSLRFLRKVHVSDNKQLSVLSVGLSVLLPIITSNLRKRTYAGRKWTFVPGKDFPAICEWTARFRDQHCRQWLFFWCSWVCCWFWDFWRPFLKISTWFQSYGVAWHNVIIAFVENILIIVGS